MNAQLPLFDRYCRSCPTLLCAGEGPECCGCAAKRADWSALEAAWWAKQKGAA